MKYIEKVWDWIVWSSANPEQVSLTTKGFLMGAITLFSFGAGLGHVSLPSELLTQVVDSVIVAVQAILGGFSAIAFAFGMIRKLILTFKGENKAITE